MRLADRDVQMVAGHMRSLIIVSADSASPSAATSRFVVRSTERPLVREAGGSSCASLDSRRSILILLPSPRSSIGCTPYLLVGTTTRPAVNAGGFAIAKRLQLSLQRAPKSTSGQSALHRKNRGRGAGTDTQFGQDTADVPVHGPFAQVEVGRNLSVGPTVHD